MSEDQPKPIEGVKIKDVRPMADEEMKREGWTGRHSRPTVLELANGQTLYPSQDPEGNGPGALFGHDDETGRDFRFLHD